MNFKHILSIFRMADYLEFETERLVLVPTRVEDADFILELLNSPKWLNHIGDRNVKTHDEAVTYITNKMLPQLEKLGYSNYTVVRKSDGVKMGVCGLYDREGLDDIDIGFAFLAQFEKQGFAFEAASRIIEAAFQTFGIKKICAITTMENIESQSLIKKLGMQFIEMVKIPNDDEELMLFELSHD